MKKALGIDFDALQMQAIEIQAELIGGLGNVDDLSHALDEEVFAVGQEDFIHERMRLREFVGYFSERGADLGQPEIVDFAHASEGVAFKQIEKRKANGAELRWFDDARTLAETCEPIAKSGCGHSEVGGGFRETVSRLVVDFVVADVHEADTIGKSQFGGHHLYYHFEVLRRGVVPARIFTALICAEAAGQGARN